MIPIRDENPTRRRAVMTFLLVAANVLIFAFVQPHGSNEAVVKIPPPAVLDGGRVTADAFLFWQAAIPCEITSLRPLDTTELRASLRGNDAACNIDAGERSVPFFHAKQPLVSALFSMFLHGSWGHVLGNVLFLWIFGNNIEDRWGRVRYLLFYEAGGVVALAAHVLAAPHSTVPVVGASGAIAAVMGAYLVMFPRARILSIVGIFPLRVRAWFLLGVWFVLQFFTDPNAGVAWIAHVGGFVFGIVVAFVWRHRRVDLDTLHRFA